MTMTSLDLFCGAGGLGTGLKAAGIIAHTAVDYAHAAAYTYRLNHPDTDVQIGDIGHMSFKHLRGIDMVVGGPPCQGFSTAGKMNENDPRNSLFHHWIRAVRETNPKYLIFENVSGFMNLYGGKAFKHLISEVKEMGYDIDFGIMDMSDYGIPQTRKRFILLGSKDRIVFPFKSHEYKKRSTFDAIGDLPVPGTGDPLHYDTKRSAVMQERLSLLGPGQSMRDLPLELQTNGFPNTYRRLDPHQPSPTITRNFTAPASGFLHYDQARPLTLREGARIQTFPDSYEFCGNRTETALQIGNAIPPMMGRILGECFA